MTKPATTAALYVNGTFTDAAGLGHKTAHVATFADIARWFLEHIARGHEVEIRDLTFDEAAAELEAMVAHFDALRAARTAREAAEWGPAR